MKNEILFFCLKNYNIFFLKKKQTQILTKQFQTITQVAPSISLPTRQTAKSFMVPCTPACGLSLDFRSSASWSLYSPECWSINSSGKFLISSQREWKKNSFHFLFFIFHFIYELMCASRVNQKLLMLLLYSCCRTNLPKDSNLMRKMWSTISLSADVETFIILIKFSTIWIIVEIWIRIFEITIPLTLYLTSKSAQIFCFCF